ncbi:unnamed protein product [Closterium sp. Naga37s-1]|nr:unnamed protein product [Closterium sp. Naga37s-1]
MLPTMSASHHLQSTAGGSRLSRSSAAATGCSAPPAGSPAVPPAASSAAPTAGDFGGVGAVPAVAATAPSADACSPRERSFSPRGKRAAECRRAPRHRHSRSFSGDFPTFHAIAPRSPAHSAIPASNSPLSRRPREDPVETAAYPGDGTCSPASPAPGGDFSSRSGGTANGARLSAQRWSLPPGTSVDGGVGMGDCPLTGGLSGSGLGSSGADVTHSRDSHQLDANTQAHQRPEELVPLQRVTSITVIARAVSPLVGAPVSLLPAPAAAATTAGEDAIGGVEGCAANFAAAASPPASPSLPVSPVDDRPAAAFLETSCNPAESLTDATSAAAEPMHSTSGAAKATVVSRAIATARFATSTSTGSSSGSHVSNSTWTTAVTNLSHESSSSERASSRLSSGLDGGVDGAFDAGNGGEFVQGCNSGFGGDTWTGAELSSAESSPRLSPSSPGFFSPSRRSFSHQQDPFQHNSLQGLLLDAGDDEHLLHCFPASLTLFPCLFPQCPCVTAQPARPSLLPSTTVAALRRGDDGTAAATPLAAGEWRLFTRCPGGNLVRRGEREGLCGLDSAGAVARRGSAVARRGGGVARRGGAVARRGGAVARTGGEGLGGVLNVMVRAHAAVVATRRGEERRAASPLAR